MLQSSKNILFLRLQVKDTLSVPSLPVLDELAKRCATNSVILFLSTKNNENFYIIWKSKEIHHFLMTKMYEDCEKLNNLKLFEFIAEFLVKSLKQGCLGKRVNDS